MADIKNTAEVLDFSLHVVQAIAKAKSDDGKIDLADVFSIALGSASEAVQAVIGAKEIPAELKDLDLDEAKVLVAKSVALANAVVALLKAPKAA